MAVANVDGREGRYYLWSEPEIRRILGNQADKKRLAEWHGALIAALAEAGADTLAGAVQVVVVGERDTAAAQGLLRTIWTTALPGRAVQTTPMPRRLRQTTPPTARKPSAACLPTAYVCVGTVCSAPVTTPDELRVTVLAMRRAGTGLD